MSALFRKKPSTVHHPDKIWSSCERKHAGILRLLREAQGQPVQIVLLTHFRKTFAAMSAALEEAGIRARRFESSVDRLTGRTVFRSPAAGGVALFHIDAWPEASQSPDDLQGASGGGVRLRIVVVERYPLPAPDRRIEALADALRVPAELEYHGALDEPLFRIFGGERIAAMMGKLGMQDDECMEHPLITKAIQRARERLAASVLVESTADSMEDWLSRNAPEAMRRSA